MYCCAIALFRWRTPRLCVIIALLAFLNDKHTDFLHSLTPNIQIFRLQCVHLSTNLCGIASWERVAVRATSIMRHDLQRAHFGKPGTPMMRKNAHEHDELCITLRTYTYTQTQAQAALIITPPMREKPARPPGLESLQQAPQHG